VRKGADVTYTVWLDAVSKDDIALTGGKGANLGELSHAGLPVPPGFVVTTRAYDAFVEAGGLKDEIVGLASRSQEEDPAAFEAAAQRIHTRFARAEIPEGVVDEIRAAYDLRTDADGLAVRSSATAEDLPGASFAGQQETYLNVRAAGALLEAVKACWASLWTARAMAYRARRGIHPATVTLAVVVQRMVPAEAAGMLFTADPVGGRRDRSVINAAWGLGEAVVGGRVTPDALVVDKASGRVISRQTADKVLMTVYTEDGTAERPVPEARRLRPVLDDEAAAELVRYGARIEDHYGAPQDIEWALADGEFFILQARPITNLPAAPPGDLRWEPPFPTSAWWRRQVVENLPEPVSPLFDELYVRKGLELSIDAVMAFFGITYLSLEDFADRPFFTTINGYAYSRADYKFSWRVFPLALRATVDEFRVIFGEETAAYWREQALPSYLAAIERWKAVGLADAPEGHLLDGVRELALADARYWFACALMIARAKITDGLLSRFLTMVARGLTSGMFLRGFPSPTVDAETELEGLAEQIRASDELQGLVAATPAAGLPEALRSTQAGQRWLAAFARYLERSGHQVYNLDFVVPTQADDPLPVLLSLKAMTQRPGRDPRARQQSIVAERDTIVEETARSLDPLRRKLFRVLLGWAQRFGPDREQALFYMGAGWPTLRRLALELGRRLTESGSLLAAEDVFFLETSEIEAAISARAAGRAKPELAGLARERRKLREARKRLHPPPVVPPGRKLRFGPFDMSAWETQRRNEPVGAVLRGFAVSPGRVTAPASVIRSPADFLRMEPGTILVCSTTTPAWTPLFSQARGLVTDVGGILAHGSIVAREYGIPAVLGTGIGTTRISSGQTIRVDGDEGTVTLVDEMDEAAAVRPAAEAPSGARNFPGAGQIGLSALVVGAAVAAAVWWKRNSSCGFLNPQARN
jgi:phosphohistidine swiveling domain-containing protein